ncbi:MAG: RtcB family protein [Phycisphaeraceae bacterium]|nr:RtcB family protein [Phycisphaeraceae bacterium]
MTSNDHHTASVHSWLAGQLDAEAKQQLAAAASLPDVRRVIVLPDAHAGARVCNGCVVATESLVYPDAVGRDIGCGYTAAMLRGSTDWCDERASLREILHRIGAGVRILRQTSLDGAPLPDSLDPEALSVMTLRSAARRDGRIQLGTLGRGNHFVEVQRDDEGHAWLMVHSGSRGIGEAIHAHHSRGAAVGRRAALLGIDRDGPDGRAYMGDALWAARWASENRKRVIDAAADAIASVAGTTLDRASLIDSPHNTIASEHFGGRELLIHRKSAVRARAGESVLIAGSAATFSVHAIGMGCAASLDSCAHGAGRARRRAEAAKRFSPREVARQYGSVVFDERLAERLRDETPGAYRDLRPVLKAQRDLARTTRRVVPLVSFKGV